MSYIRVAGAALALCVLLASCQQAVTSKEPQPEPQLPADELLRGSWRSATPWTEDEVLVGTRIVTLTFTESRLITQMSYVYDSGEPASPWANARSGPWSVTDAAVTITWYDDDEDGATTEGPVNLEYFWVDVGSKLILQESEDTVATNEYILYRKIDSIPPPIGSWTMEFENDEGIVESWTMFIDGTDFRWINRPNPDMAYEDTGIVADIDQDEMFISVNLTEDGDATGQTWRIAYAAGYGDDALAVSPVWSEGVDPDDTGHWSFPNPRRPYGNYNLLMRRDAE